MRKRLLVGLGALFLVFLLASTEVVSGQTVIKKPEDYEAKQFIPVLDIWVNVSSATLLQANEFAQQPDQANNAFGMSVGDFSGEPPGWELRHYWIVPDNPQIKWEVYDPNLKIVPGFLGKAIHDDDNGFSIDFGFSFIAPAKAVEDSDPGYEHFDYRDIDTVKDFDNEKILAGATGAIIDLDASQIDDNTLPSQVNYTFPDLETDGIYYFADDSKSAIDYGKDMAERDGVTFYNLVNASAVGFAYDDTYDELDSVVWAFDEVATTLPLAENVQLNGLPSEDTNPQLNGFTLKRYRISLHQMQKKLSSLGGKVSKTIKNTSFKKIGKVAIAASPVGATYYFSKKIGNAFHGLPMKVGSLASGVFKSFVNIIIAVVVGLFLLVIIGVIIKIVF